MTNAAALFTAKSPPGLFAAQAPAVGAPLGSNGGTGAISGGLLRPGSIDQTTFLQMLQQQQQNRQAAGVGGKPVGMPLQSFQTASSASSAPSIPTLTSAQFAALVGAQNADPGLAAAPAEAPAADPQASAAAQQAQAGALNPMTAALKLSGGTAGRNTPAKPAENPQMADNSDADAPTISRRSNPQEMAAMDAAPSAEDMPSITRNSAPVLDAAATESPQPRPADSDSETASKGDPDVVHLKQPPDKDEQKDLRMRNKRWVVDETPGARQLFFGADGKFGWDDFLDMINPLQHIPGIAQIYRAVTGDQINGAANLLGAIPFGPFGGLGLIATVADLAVKDSTGKDIGDNLEAMIFGKGETPEGGAAVPADMAQAGQSDESGTVTAEATSRRTAYAQTAYAASDASEMHSACRG